MLSKRLAPVVSVSGRGRDGRRCADKVGIPCRKRRGGDRQGPEPTSTTKSWAADRQLVFAHGAGGNHLSWWQQVPYFGERFTCVTFDHRGFGRSLDARAAPAERPSFDDDLAALIDHLGSTECGCGAVDGRLDLPAYTVRHPERVKALVMADTAGTADLAEPLDAGELGRLQKWMAEHQGVEDDLFRREIHPAAGERMAREQPTRTSCTARSTS